MKLDIHITTCHRYNVKCRPRAHESSLWNVKEWTHEERLEISKISVNSIIKLAEQLKTYKHEVAVTLLDDGSDIPSAIEWIDSLKDKIVVKKYSNRGSSAGINDHISDLKEKPDYIFHVEDDNLLFNPFNNDWLSIINDIKVEIPSIKVFTFRSGLPVERKDKGFTGDWGPIGFEPRGKIKTLLFKRMGNAHHIIRYDDYLKFLPLEGNTGGCEAFMNERLTSLGLNAEPQIHVHCFHSHMYKYPISTNRLNEWHKTGEGFEFGIYDMDMYLKSRQPVVSTLYNNFPDEINSVTIKDYDY